jgi:hypothetical protein
MTAEAGASRVQSGTLCRPEMHAVVCAAARQESEANAMPGSPSSPEGRDSPHTPAVPADFRAEVGRADAGGHPGDLELLAVESRGFEWEREGLRLIEHARLRLERSGRVPQPAPGEPRRVLLFTGHMIDEPGRERPRFPPDMEGTARRAIRETVLGEHGAAGAVAYGIAGGASGGDILFHEVCAELDIRTRLFLAVPPGPYVRASVRPAGEQWVGRFERLLRRLPARVLGETEELPRWLRAKPHYNVWQRNNLWMLYNALAAGGENVTLVALWDGEVGDGSGGTSDMVRGAEARGAKTVILDTGTLFGT